MGLNARQPGGGVGYTPARGRHPSDSLNDENYYANDNYRSNDSVSKHFASPQKCCSAVVIGYDALWDNIHFELARAWPLNENQLGVTTPKSGEKDKKVQVEWSTR